MAKLSAAELDYLWGKQFQKTKQFQKHTAAYVLGNLECKCDIELCIWRKARKFSKLPRFLFDEVVKTENNITVFNVTSNLSVANYIYDSLYPE